MKIRTTIQPTVEVEVDDGERAVLEHQGLVWSGTDAELAELYAAAGLPAPAPAAPSTGAKTTTTSASTTTAKEA